MMYSSHDTFDGTFILDQFLELGKKYSAEIHEFILYADKQVTLLRLAERGYSKFGLNTPEKAERHWENMELLKNERHQANLVDTTNMTIDEVFDEIVKTVG